jgi:hypothetical protein
MRLRPAKEFKTLPSDFKNLYQFDEKGLLELKDSNDKVICSSFYHFMIKGKYLITDLSMLQTISPFTSYINKIIPETPCDFVPLILNDELNLSEVSMVTFKDQLQSVIDEDENSNISLKNMASSLLKLVCPTVDTLDELIEDKMITAAMTIQLKRPKRMTTEDYSHKLSAILAPIQDLKDVYIKLSNGKKIEGSQLVYTRKCELEDGEPNTYIKEMRNLLEQIEHK